MEKIRFHNIIFFFFFGLLGVVLPPFCLAESQQSIYFYNPETTIKNFTSLKAEFDAYLNNFGPYKFQPFKKKESFEAFLASKKNGVFLLSSWYFQNLPGNLHMDPVLVGVFKGKSMQKKVLTSKKNITNLGSLKGKIIASAGDKDFVKNILGQIIGIEKGDLLDSMKLLSVQRDIDALMAVGFGMANAALTTEKSLAKLSKINPKQYNLLAQLGKSRNMFLVIVAVPEESNENWDDLLAILEKMGTDAEGKKKLKMLGLDGWRKLSLKEIAELKHLDMEVE